LDAEGNGVSATSTVNRWFGAVVQSDKLGIVWNDEMDDFSSPGMANGFGFAPSETNFIVPGKKPMSSMSPMLIYDKKTGDLKMVVGASGGSKIISAMAKPIVRTLFFNETIKEAIDAPTLHNQFTPDVTQLEGDVPEELVEDLKTIFGQTFKPTTGFEGIMQAILVNDDGSIYANGDFRRKTDMHPGGY
uniref:Gamma-glutamyltransferase n=1 Tax=Anisakis simplex TaxID=6269 RepID=A0A0M3K822_ANISI